MENTKLKIRLIANRPRLRQIRLDHNFDRILTSMHKGIERGAKLFKRKRVRDQIIHAQLPRRTQ